MKKQELKSLQSHAEKILSLLSIKAEVNIEEDAESVIVRIESEESGLLIGYHGKTLDSLQLILSLLMYKEIGERVPVIVTVGDYREQRSQQLTEMAQKLAEQVIETEKEAYVPYLSPYERRVVHIALADHPEVETESVGEKEDRRLVIKKRAHA